MTASSPHAHRAAQLVLLHRSVWDANDARDTFRLWLPTDFPAFPVMAALLVEHDHQQPQAPEYGQERALAIVHTAHEHAVAAAGYRKEVAEWRATGATGAGPHCPWSVSACAAAQREGGGDPMVLRHLGRSLVMGQIAEVVAPENEWVQAANLTHAHEVMERAARARDREITPAGDAARWEPVAASSVAQW